MLVSVLLQPVVDVEINYSDYTVWYFADKVFVCVQRHSDLVGQHQAQLLSVWRSVVALRQQCHTVKTAADR